MNASRCALLGWLLVSFAQPASVAADAPPGPTAEQIAQLEETLTGAAMVGNFTESGGDAPDKLHQERYELARVKHLGDGQWLFEARIRYGDHDVQLPLTLPVRWAGDTPVITVDQLPVIGMGTFDARVMIYRDHYAGFWSGEDHGGHLFGVIERKTEPSAETPAK